MTEEVAQHFVQTDNVLALLKEMKNVEGKEITAGKTENDYKE